MSTNDDALRCAALLDEDVCDLQDPREPAAHLRRLVAENEAMRKQVAAFGRLTTVQTEQLSFHRARADKAQEAIRTLQSERDASAILTAENAALTDSCAAKADRIDRLGATVVRLTVARKADHKAMQQAVDALAGAIEWDRARDFAVPYRVRDPLSAALASLRERLGAAAAVTLKEERL